MLVLARKHGQSIFVGDDIEITIVEVRGDVVRLGVNAPSTVPVYRKEIWDKIKAENEAAASSAHAATGGLPVVHTVNEETED